MKYIKDKIIALLPEKLHIEIEFQKRKKNWRKYNKKRELKMQEFLRAFNGSNVYCPCCNKYFSHFDTFKVDAEVYKIELYINTPLDVICPYCNSLPRHRIVCNNLKSEMITPKSSKILIFAPIMAYKIWFKRNYYSYISADLSGKADLKVDIQDTHFSDNEFDFISCDHVLEHVPDYVIALQELYRTIKVGGFVEITIPMLPGLSKTYEDNTIENPVRRRDLFGQDDHLRIFGMDFYEKLKTVGFDVSTWDGDDCDEKIMPVIGPSEYDYNKIFICRKL